MKMKTILNVLLVGVMAFTLMACGSSDEQVAQGSDVNQENLRDNTYVIDAGFEAQTQSLVKQFYEKVFSEASMQDLYWAAEGRNVLEPLREMMSEETLDKWEGTRELPVHYPRFVQIHGLTMYDYDLLTNEEGTPKITTRFYESNQAGDKFSFFTEVELKAYVILKDRFEDYYSDRTEYFGKISNIPEEDKEFIKIKARYDVVVSTKDGSPKIVSALESTSNRNKWVRHPLNNDFVERLPFHDLDTLENNQEYLEETAFIKDFMEDMFSKIDRSTNSIINFEWDRGGQALETYLLDKGLLTREDGQMYFYDMFDENDDDSRSYRTRINKDVFPIKPGMERINSINIKFNQFPSYTSAHRSYRVKVNAWGQTIKGALDGVREYEYEYNVILNRQDEEIYIDEIRLNSYKMVR